MNLLSTANIILNIIVACISIVATLVSVRAYLRKKYIKLSQEDKAYQAFVKEKEKSIPSNMGTIIVRTKKEMQRGTITVKRVSDGVMRKEPLHIGRHTSLGTTLYAAIGNDITPDNYLLQYCHPQTKDPSQSCLTELAVWKGKIAQVDWT